MPTIDAMSEHVKRFFGDDGSSTRPFRLKAWCSDDYSVAPRIVQRYHESSLSLLQNQKKFSSSDNGNCLKIPRIVHFIWLGSKPVTDYQDLDIFCSQRDTTKNNNLYSSGTIKSWILYNRPEDGWEIKLWTESSIKDFHDKIPASSRVRDAYKYAIEIENYGMASDITRLEILYEFGGLYVDIDYYCFRCFNDLHQEFDFYCGASNTGCIEINNGLIGSRKGYFLIHGMMEKISDWFSSRQNVKEKQNLSPILSSFLDESSLASCRLAQKMYAPMESIENTGPGLITRMIFEIFREPQEQHDTLGAAISTSSKIVEQSNLHYLTVLPSTFFHPLPNSQRLSFKKDNKKADTKDYTRILRQYIIPDKTRALHLWGCSWQE